MSLMSETLRNKVAGLEDPEQQGSETSRPTMKAPGFQASQSCAVSTNLELVLRRQVSDSCQGQTSKKKESTRNHSYTLHNIIQILHTTCLVMLKLHGTAESSVSQKRTCRKAGINEHVSLPSLAPSTPG